MDSFPKNTKNTESCKMDTSLACLGSKGKIRGIQRQPCVSTQSPLTAKRESGQALADTLQAVDDSKIPHSVVGHEAVGGQSLPDPPVLFNRTVSDGVTQLIAARRHKEMTSPSMPSKTVTFLDEAQHDDVRLKRLCRTPTPYSRLDSEPSHDEEKEGEASQNTHPVVRYMKSAPPNLQNPLDG